MKILERLFHPSYHAICVLAGLALCFAAPVSHATPKPEDDISRTPSVNQSLEEVSHKFFDKVYAKQNLSLSGATKIYVGKVSASFSKYWERDHRTDVTRRYKTSTLERYSRLLQEQLNNAIEKSEMYEVVNNAAEADLIFQPALNRLNIFAPDDFIGKSLVFQAGLAELDLLVVDARSNEALIHYVDNRDTRYTASSRPVRANRATNTHDFKMLMKKWSVRVVKDMELRAQ